MSAMEIYQDRCRDLLCSSRSTPPKIATQNGVFEVEDLKEVAADVDVLYQTRIQKERFTDMQVGARHAVSVA